MKRKVGTTRVDVHKGKAVMQFAAEYYRLSQAIKELIQNKLDNGAKNIHCVLDLKERTLEILGDGLGTSAELFAKAMENVCNSIKGGVKSKKYGRFGLGFFSPADKCRKFYFTATDPHLRTTHEWIIEQKKIKDKRDFELDCFEVDALPDGFTTRCFLEGIINDRARTRINLSELCSQITQEYSVGLERNDAVIQIIYIDESGKRHDEEITHVEFKGEEIAPVEYSYDDFNSAEFYLYVSPIEDSKRRGVVMASVKDDPYRITLKDILKAADSKVINPKAKEALNSGAFNGEIISTGCELTESRLYFRKNDALSAFCEIINTWWAEIGSDIYENIRIEEETSRFQDLGKRALEDMARILSDPKLVNFRDLINQFRVGRIGDEHANVPKSRVKEVQDVPSISASTPEEKEKGKGSRGKSKEKFKPEEHEGHLPLSVTGKRGSRRTEVFDNSLGIQISHSEMIGDFRMYDFDDQSGILDINIMHPNWTSLEFSDEALIEYQIQCLFTALVSVSNPDEEHNEQYEKYAKPHLELIVGRLKLSK